MDHAQSTSKRMDMEYIRQLYIAYNTFSQVRYLVSLRSILKEKKIMIRGTNSYTEILGGVVEISKILATIDFLDKGEANKI